jgi:hypothetical protein
MQQQIDLIEGLQREWETDGVDVASLCYSRSRGSSIGNVGQNQALSPPRHISPPPPVLGRAIRNSYKNFSLSALADPIKQLVANLHRENFDLIEVRDNCNNLVTRTIQLVNIRLEDHGKSIMVFTMVTTIFLPLSFLSSYFGMNTSDIRTMAKTQVTFWYWALPTTFIVVGIALVMAIWGGRFWQEYVSWRRRRKELKNAAEVASMGPSGPIIKLTDRVDTFEVLGVQKY